MEQKQIFSIRKFKTGTHSALLGKIALGSVAVLSTVILAQGVSADETTSLSTSATNITAAQVSASTENASLESQANTSQGAITQPVTSDTLTVAVNDAKAQGVEVSEGQTVSHDSLDSAKEDLAKQEAEVKSATKEKEDNTQAVKQAEATNAQIQADNHAEKERVAKVNKQGQAAVDQRNQAGQAAVDEANANEDAKVKDINSERDRQAETENQQRNAEYQAKLKEIQDVIVFNEGVRQRNEANLAVVTERNKKAQEEYEKALTEYNQAQAAQGSASTSNEEKKAAYEKALAAYQTQKAAYEKALAEYQAKKATYEKELADYQVKKAELEAKTKEDGHLSQVEAQELIFIKEPTATATISGQTANLSLEATNNANLVGNIHYLDADNYSSKDFVSEPVLGDTINEGGDLGKSYKILMSIGKTTTVKYDNLQNTSFNGRKISSVEYTYTPTKAANKDGLVTAYIYKDPTNTIRFGSQLGGGLTAIDFTAKFYYEDGSLVDFTNGSALIAISSLNASDSVGGIEHSNNKDATSIYREYVSNVNGTFYKINGSSVDDHGGTIYSDTNNNAISETWDKPNSKEAYYGAGVLKLNGSTIRLTFGSTADAIQWWAFNSAVTVDTLPPAPQDKSGQPPVEPTAPTPPTYTDIPNLPSEPVKPTPESFTPEKEKEIPSTPPTPETVTPVHVTPKYVTFTPETYTPVTPTEKPLVSVPETLHIKASVHPVEVKQEPKISKDVVNTDGVSTDGATVVTGSTQTWVLHPSLIKGGRPTVTSITFKDAFPSGFDVDKDASAKLNQQYYTVVYDENGVASINGNAALINAVNANPSSDYVLPDIFYVGQPTLANTTFKNTYKQVISFPNGEYVTVSNTPKITTPNVQPKKENRNLDGVDINGKAMTIGATNDYRLTWNLSQYKGAVLTANEIAKGFFFIDDFPEEAVTINKSGITLTANGKAVEGVSHKVYQSLDELPSNLKETFTKQGIKPKGAFQVFTADNSQAFYDTYVKTGTDIVISDKMVVKDELRGTGASYENIAYQVDFGQGYVTETVKNHVPKVTPLKEDFNSKGVNIDGKSVLAGSVNHYKLTWDLDQYKDMSADKETISKGFFYVDDYPADVVTVLKDQVRVYTLDKDGKEVPVEGVSVHYYENLSDIPENIAKTLTEYGYTPKGKLQVFLADDPQAFYDTYVSKGLNIYVSNPMQVKDEVAKTGAAYENTAIQVDFGKAQGKSTVHNNVPKFEAVKDVKVNGQSVDGGVIQLNEHFSYTLKGVLIPADSSEPFNQYAFRDDYDQEHDHYTGVYRVIAETDFTLNFKDKDGKVEVVKVSKGDDITKYTSHQHDEENGIVTIDFTKDFYDAFDNQSEFQASVELMMTRIKDGEVYNTFENIVNGVTVLSNKVKTTTPKPETPQPNTPTPTKEVKTLPTTGETSSLSAVVLGSILGLTGLVGLKRKKN